MTETSETATGADRATTVERLLDTIVGSRTHSVIALLIVALVAFLPGLKTIAPLDRDEARYALETKLVVETGGYAEPVSASGSLIDRPALTHWLQFWSVSLFGDGPASPIWLYRLPALIAAIAVPFLTWWMGLAFGRPRAAFLAAVLIATTPLLVAEAHLAKPDAFLLATIVLSQGALARLWQRKKDDTKPFYAFLFWTGLGLGILAKGPIAPLVIGLTIAVLSAYAGSFGWLRRLMPIAGVIWLAAIVAVWFFAAGLGASSLLAEGVFPTRIAVQEVYEAPPGTYAILFYPLFGPAGVFVALAIPGVLDRLRRPVFLFAIASIVPFWLIVELWPVKLPYYILPVYPMLALVGATAIDDGWLRTTGWISTYFSLNLLAWPVLVGVGATALFYAGEGQLPYFALPFFAGGIAAGLCALIWFLRRSQLVASAVLSVTSAMVLYAGLFGVVIADLGKIQISSRMVAEGRESVSCDKPEFVSTGYFEPSIVFYAGNGISLSSPEEAADFLAEGGCRVAFVESRRQSIFNQRTEDIGLDLNVRQEIRGFNLGNWKLVKMRIFAVEGPAT